MPVTGTPSNGLTSGNQPSLTIAHTSNTDPLYVLLSYVGGVGETTSLITGVTFNGVALSLVGFDVKADNSMAAYRLESPAAVTANVVISLSANRRISAGVFNRQKLSAVETIIFETAGGLVSSGQQPTITIDSDPDGEVFDWIGWNSSFNTSAAGAGQTEIWSQDGMGGGVGSGGDQKSAGSSKAGASPTVTMSWTLTGDTAELWGQAALSFIPAEPTFDDGEPGTIPTFEITLRDDTVRPFSNHDGLNDRASYYSGKKAFRAFSFTAIKRSLSGSAGQIDHPTFGIELGDKPRDLRALLDDATNQYLTHSPVAVRTVSDADRRAELPMRIEMVGYVGRYKPTRGLKFTLPCIDWRQKKLARRNTAPEFWVPLLTRDDFPLLPDALVNKAAPFYYGEISDEVTVDVDLLPRGNADPGWLELGYNHLAAAGPSAGDYCLYVTAITGGVESMVMPFMVGFYLDGSQQVVGYFKTATLPDLFRVYFSDGRDVFHPFANPNGGTFSRYRDYDPNVAMPALPGDPGGCAVPDTDPFGNPNVDNKRFVIIDSVSWGSDYRAIATSGGGSTTLQAGRGPVPTLDVGDLTIGGITRRAFLVQRFAMKSIDGVHVGGVLQTSVGSSTEIEAPFLGDYETVFGANYIDINGRRYTIVFATGQTAINAINGSKPITVSGQFIESIGDTSGTLLRSPVRQAEHFERNFLGAETPVDTLWKATPDTFPNIPTLPIQDTNSYDAAEAALQARIDGGYETAGGIGVGGAFESGLDVMAALAVSGDFDLGTRRRGQSFVSVEPAAAPEGATAFNDVHHIDKDSFDAEVDGSIRDFWNIQPLVHTKDYAGATQSGWSFSGVSRDASSITNFRQEKTSNRWDYRFLRAATAQGIATVLDVIQRKRLRYRQPLRQVTFSVPFRLASNVELGNVLRITHREGPGDGGWTDHDIRVTELEIRLDDLTVVITGYDLAPIYAGLDDEVEPTQIADGLKDQTSIVQLQEQVRDTQIETATIQAEIVTIDARLTEAELAVRTRGRVRVATTANITIATALNAGDVIDGVTLADGDLVLVKDQTADEENGIYVAGASPARATQYSGYDDHPGSLITVQEGTTNADTLWLCTSNQGGTLNTTAIAFSQFTGGGGTGTVTHTGGALTLNKLMLGAGSDDAKVVTASDGQIPIGKSSDGTVTLGTVTAGSGISVTSGPASITIAATGGGLTDPSTLTGLALWLKADAGVYKDAGVTLAADTDTVQQWNDQSGNNNHVSQATSGKRPTYRTGIKNGLPVVRFGAAHCLQRASFSVSTLTVICVIKNTNSNVAIIELSATVNSNDGFYLFSGSNDGCAVKKGGVFSGRVGPNAWAETNQYIVAGQSYKGTLNDHYLLYNGNQQLTGPDNSGTNPGTGTTTDTLNIGARNNAASNAMNGDICELLIYTPALSMANARAVMQYLQSRWDV